jgi:diaminopimelate decarboxylase
MSSIRHTAPLSYPISDNQLVIGGLSIIALGRARRTHAFLCL